MSTHLRSLIVLLAFGACICSASARVFGGAQAPARQPAVTTGVVYGYQRYGERALLTKTVDDVLFGTIGVRTARERSLRDLPNVRHVPVFFWTNLNFELHECGLVS
jgi:hypothetical protein